MPELTYYIFNLVVFAPVLLLSIFSDVQPYKQWRRLSKVFVFVSLPFIYWDIWAAAEGHWGFSEAYITSFRLVGLPIEEILFFITVPFACLFVWGVIQKHYRAKQRVSDATLKAALFTTLVIALPLLVIFWANGYSRSAFIAFLIMVVILCRRLDIVRQRQFWVFQTVVLGLFILFNSFLTALPVITYGPDAITGFRIGTIPLEDFFFNFALINLSLVAFVPRIDKTMHK